MFSRIVNLFRAIFSAGVRKGEESRYRELLDLNYEQLQEMLVDVDRDLADVAQAKARIEQLLKKNRADAARYESLASKFLEASDEPQARQALQSKAFVDEQLGQLEANLSEVAEKQTDLTATRGQVQVQIQQFAATKEVTKARISTARATVNAGETITGISKKAGNLGRTTARLLEHADQLEARSNGLRELISTGALTNIFEPDSTPLERSGRELERNASVEADLERLKKQLPSKTGA